MNRAIRGLPADSVRDVHLHLDEDLRRHLAGQTARRVAKAGLFAASAPTSGPRLRMHVGLRGLPGSDPKSLDSDLGSLILR